MSKLEYGTPEYEAIVRRAEKLSHKDLLELTIYIGVRFDGDDALDEDLLGVLSEADSKEKILEYLEKHGV